MNKSKNILIVHNYYQIPGGEDTVVSNEIQMLKAHGHKVILYSRSNDELKEMRVLQKLMLPINTVFNIKTYKDIKRIIRDENINIVHVHNTLNLISPSVYYAAIKSGIPVVQTIHNFRLLCPNATFYRDGHICEDCIKTGLRCAIKYNCYHGSKIQTLACVINTLFHRMTGIYGEIYYICLTEFNKEKLLKVKQIKSTHVYIKSNFVKSSENFIPEEERATQFIFVGRLDKLKGIDILLEAWKRMGKRAPKLVVCGTGPMEDWCKEFVIKNKINVEILGFISNVDARKLIANSRGLILPTQWYEGFPMSIVEAYSVGTPVICSNIGNAGCIVEEGVTGVKFKYNSVNQLVDAVKRCHELCNSTLSVYKEKYTETINYQKLINIYNDLE